MYLHIDTLGDDYLTQAGVKYVEPSGQLNLDHLKEKEMHTTIMDALAITLYYSKYKDVEELEGTYKM